MSALAKWVLAVMIYLQPPEKVPQMPGYPETAAEAEERYGVLAIAIADAAEATRPGMSARSKAALLVAISAGETRWSLDTDIGPCYRGAKGGPFWTRCDSGKAASVWQLHAVTLDGVKLGPADFFADRNLSARVALRAALGSLYRCRHLPAIDRLSALGGSCVKGLKAAQDHYLRWRRIESWEPPP